MKREKEYVWIAARWNGHEEGEKRAIHDAPYRPALSDAPKHFRREGAAVERE